MSESESLVERVARALDPLAWAALGLADTERLAFRRKRSMEQAVAAIRAMREPTEAMIGNAVGTLYVRRGGEAQLARQFYTAAIDAALA